MKTLYFDCFSGISGDMTIGALLDLGVSLDYLKTELQKLTLDGYRIGASRVVRANLSAMKFDVIIEGDPGHPHADGHDHGHAHGGHGHRKASEILELIRSSRLNANTKRMAEAIFIKLAESEGRVHHMAPEDVEFHEVGAVDSIVDTVGTAIGFDALGIEKFVCSPINVGGGFIHCQHGVYPVPVPATADLLRGAEIYSRHVAAELVTPTGAAILAAMVGEFRSLSGFATERIGYGAGTKQFQDFPNCLRLMLGEEKSGTENAVSPAADEILVIETNIDDMTPQNFAYVTEQLLDAGALDVCTMSVLMKKGRPGYVLQVLSPINRGEVLANILFEETTSIGLRQYVAKRRVLARETVTVQTAFGAVRIKVATQEGRVLSHSPEYEDCARLAREKGVALKEVQAAALAAFGSQQK